MIIQVKKRKDGKVELRDGSVLLAAAETLYNAGYRI